jgi:hypothetical protein
MSPESKKWNRRGDICDLAHSLYKKVYKSKRERERETDQYPNDQTEAAEFEESMCTG